MDEKMEQIFFKVGTFPERQMTVCVSFFPKADSIDVLFDDVTEYLCKELCLTPEELLKKVDLESCRSALRIMVIQDRIAQIAPSTDVYEVVEQLTDAYEELKTLRNSDEAYQRNKFRKIEQAEQLALSGQYQNAISIFLRFKGDPKVCFRIYLLYLENDNWPEAQKYFEIFSNSSEFAKNKLLLCSAHKTYINNNLKGFMEDVRAMNIHGLIEEPFFVSLFARLRNKLQNRLSRQ